MEFEELIKDIDIGLTQTDVPIHARPLRATMELGRKLGIGISLVPSPLLPDPTGATEEHFASRVNEWYRTMYGDRLNLQYSPGSVGVVLRGDPWRMILPLVYGTVQCVCKRPRDIQVASARGVPPDAYNVLDCIEDLPEGLANDFHDVELDYTMRVFSFAMEALNSLRSLSGTPLAALAFADLESAVDHLMQSPPQYGLSKWASLQFTEKLLKCFLQLKRADYERIHNLRELADMCHEHGLRALPDELLDKIQCKGGVRYGEIQVKQWDALRAHHDSLVVGLLISPGFGDA